MSATDTVREQPRRRVRPFVALFAAIDRLLPSIKPALQKALVKRGYEYLNRRSAYLEVGCMNYGFAPTAESPWAPADDFADQYDRYGLQLYGRVLAGTDVAGKDVLEVGCGRGSGAAYIAATASPRTMTGLDLSRRGIEWCRNRHSIAGLSFVVGDAEDLPFEDGRFDTVLNVESSHNYPHMDLFLREAHRVLRPGGRLLFADIRLAVEIDPLRDQVAAEGFDVLEDELITANVARALELDAARRQHLVATETPRWLRPAMGDFIAVPGSTVPTMLSSGTFQYLRLLAQRPEGACP
jgi:ubiquinone/menaquinone biosynthesis C-methylase UbiE